MEKNPQGAVMKKSPLRKRIVASFLGVGLLFCTQQVSSAEPQPGSTSELAWVVARIKEHEATLKTFTAAFQQTKKTALLKKPLESQGLVYFDSKGKLLLSVTSPSRVKILFENGRMTVYDPDTLEAQERYLGSESMVKKYFGIGASMEELKKQYALELLPQKHARDYHLRLTPKAKAMAEHIQTIDVCVSSNQWLPQRIEVRETDGDVTSIMLDFTSINVPLPQDTFEIEVRENH